MEQELPLMILESRRQLIGKAHSKPGRSYRSIPVAVYPILWSFLLSSSDTTEPVDGYLIHFKIIASFRLVSRGSNEA
jgi:hypothetical protein